MRFSIKSDRFHDKSLFFLMFVVTMFFFLIYSFPVDAHSTLEKTLPKADSTLDKSPSTVELWFEDPVAVHSQSITVTNEKGTEFQKGEPFVDAKDRRHILISLENDLPPSSYIVKYNVITLDGYVLQGGYRFIVKEPVVLDKGNRPKLNLEKSSPADGEIIKTSPKQVELWFAQPAELTAFGVFDDQQVVVPTKEPYTDPQNPHHVIVEFDQELSAGTYQVSWYAAPIERSKTKSAFDEIQGVFYFAVDQVSSITPPQGVSTASWLMSLGFKPFAHWLSFMGLLTLLGGTWFYFAVAKEQGNHERWNKSSLLLYVLSITGFFLLLIQNRVELSQLPFSEFLSLKIIWIPIVQIVILTLGYWLVRGKLRILFLVITVLLWPFITGHSTYPRYGGLLTMGIDILHLLGVSIWLGGLFALMIMIPKENGLAWLKEVGLTYSKWALWSMIVIILTGIGMVLKFVPSFTWVSLVASDWGKALLFKVVLSIAIISLAYLQRRLLIRITSKVINSFSRRVKIELSYAVLILFAASILIESTPSAAEQGVYPKSMVKDNIQLTVDIVPFRVGVNDITMHFQNQPEFQSVRVKFFMPPVMKKENQAFSLGDGTYRVTGNYLDGAGTMFMEVEAVKMNGEKIVYPFRIIVPGEIPK